MACGLGSGQEDRREGEGVSGVGGGHRGVVCRLTSVPRESLGVSGRGGLMK